MIVDSAVYRDGERLATEAGGACDAAGLAQLRASVDGDDFVWVGLSDPSREELAAASDAFGLHPLAVEDALEAHQRPKLERYDETLFLVLKTLWYVDADDAVETGELAVFAGHGFVVTVRHGEGGSPASSRRFLEERAAVLQHGPAAVLYAVCDHVVDEYEHVGSALQVDVDEVERSVFSTARTNDSVRIYTLKREIAEARRAVLPLRDPMRRFAAGEVEGVDEETAPYFRDVHDHLQRVAGLVDDLDTLLSSAFDAHLARISVQQNEDMRTISAGAALVVVPTLIAGVYGMNFTHMPELDWVWGYPFALVLMLASSVGLWVFFKRSGWL